MATDIGAINPLTLTQEMVRVVFPVEQTLAAPDVSSLPDLVGRWNHANPAGTPVNLSYAFDATAPAYEVDAVEDPGSYTAYTAEEMASVTAVLLAYQAICGITFVPIDDPLDAQLVFRKAQLVPSGFAFYPPFSVESAAHGDVFLDTEAAGGAYIAFHEIGHALGLEHPFATYKPVPEDYGVARSRLLSVVDQAQLPRPFVIYDTDGGVGIRQVFHPVTPMPLDILALQMLYGANPATNAGDTAYTYDVDPEFFATLWDAGGKDTIDLSNQVNPCLITLEEGTFSTIGLRDPFAGRAQWIIDWATDFAPADKFYDGSNALAIAFGTVIENATGGSAGDRLIGNAVANVLDGGPGADTMAGGAGGDTYVVDDPGDVVTESAAQGKDLVRSSVTWQLGPNVEELTLTGTAAIDGTGNGLANLITGQNLANRLTGGAGDDTLRANNGPDTLIGGTGADSMTGGAGNDTFVVDNALDAVVELAGGGTDQVNSSLTYTLATDVEKLLLTGSSAIDGTGNDLNNLLIGNTAANALDGGVGNDTMKGGAGDDTYTLDSAGDVVQEKLNQGTDTVLSSVTHNLKVNVENLTLNGGNAINGTGNTLANVINGNDANNQLRGGSAADTIVGGGGNDNIFGGIAKDVLTGGAGADNFFFTETPSALHADTIMDFESGVDRLRLDDAVFTQIGALGAFAAGDVRFHAAAGVTSGHDADDRIIYNTTNGNLYYDADGAGGVGGALFATLDGAPGLQAQDIVAV